MVSRRYSQIAHAFLPFAAPIASDVVGELLPLLPLRPGDRVLDVGCGRAELLLRCLQAHAVQGVGIDNFGLWLFHRTAAAGDAENPGAAVAG